jgi:hypothetical protein
VTLRDPLFIGIHTDQLAFARQLPRHSIMIRALIRSYRSIDHVFYELLVADFHPNRSLLDHNFASAHLNIDGCLIKHTATKFQPSFLVKKKFSRLGLGRTYR